MQFSLFIARRFFQYIGQQKSRASNPTITIATFGVAIGLAVMLVSVCVILGFKREITNKVSGFGSHIEVMDPRSISAPDVFPIEADSALLSTFRKVPQVQSVDVVVQKMGIIKTKEDFKSVNFKGIAEDYDTTFIASSLVAGRLPQWGESNGNEVLISQLQADELRLKVGDRFFSYFFESDIKTRRFKVVGIYRSNMTIFDQHIVFAPLSTLQKLNQWEAGQQASVLEIRLHDFEAINQVQPIIAQLNEQSDAGNRHVISIKQHFAQVFAWLDLLDFNMIIILCLMTTVSGFTMISGLFILILERTQVIGVLKALGASNTRIRQIFLFFSAFITLRGMLLGNAIALLLLFSQQQWGWMRLDATTYYVETVPVELHWPSLLLINIGCLLLTTLALVVPSMMISRIQPAKAIRFE